MKILELTNFSSGICGVWARVREESLRLSERGHEVKVFSSDFVKGENSRAPAEDRIEGVEIKRFPARKLGGESFMIWKFRNEAINFNPDVIIAHGYRHKHTTEALKIAKKIGCKVFLVTHGPFLSENRTSVAKLAVEIYDKTVGKKTLNKFNAVGYIAKWELPFLKSLSVSEKKLVYLPNGIPEEFFSLPESNEQNYALFLGRVSPVKNIEVLIRAVALMKNKIPVKIYGPAEDVYLAQLRRLVADEGLEKYIEFLGPVFKVEEKIRVIDRAKVFVLPSLRESMPQSLIEGMSRGKVVISSDNLGGKELVTDNENGILFSNGVAEDLARKLEFAISQDLKEMKRKARKSVEQFSWEKVILKVESVIRN